MPTRNSRPLALIHAPAGRDAQIAAALLAEIGIGAVVAEDLKAFTAALDDEVTFAVLTEEATRGVDLRPIADWLAAQPSWSDLPLIVLTQRGGGPERNPAAARLLEILGNVSFVERPFHPTTFASVAGTALRSRRRQYEARGRMEDLDEGERRLQTAIEAGRLGSWELDLESWTLNASATCRAIFGRGPAETLTYDDLLALIHPDDLETMQKAARATMETGSDFAVEYRVRWQDGSIHWVEVRARLYRNLGRAMRMVGVCADITARKQAEESQRQLNEILEIRVAERTRELEAAHASVIAEAKQRELAEVQLRQSQKMEAIGQLTGGVAHDFNNLLMAVIGNLDLLGKHCSGDARAERLIEGAMQGAKRGAALTQRLLAFARRQDLRVEPVDLTRLVAGMEDLLKRSVGSQVAIAIEVPERLPLVNADPNQVELALLNLAVNARDAMPEGGTISISLQEAHVTLEEDELLPGRYLVLAVSDTGQGMDEETLEKAIEPFFSTKELGKGTGLGLSMIHGLALQLKGRLKLSSLPGQGTKAELWMPVSLEEPAIVAPTVELAAVTEDLGPKRILLVDDDALISMSSADMLIDLGHDVVEASSGREALDHLQAGEQFDLMITDYSMPGMTGAELAQAVRGLRPQLRILLATGYADLPNGVEIDVPRLAKPYTQSQLSAEISKLLAAR